jgi:iron complex transport system ATP-binding protein
MAEAGLTRVAAHGAGHSYDGRAWQFRDLDFAVRAGEVAAVLGPNGRGKTTLLRVGAGLRKPTLGRIATSGVVGLVPQDFARTFPYSVLDIVLMGRARHVGLLAMPGKRDRDAALAALAVTGMTAFAERGFDSLSGGERQLVLIARAIAGEPATLLLDEPASALDLKNQDRVLSLIRRLADDKLAIVFTTHQPNHALAVADSVLLMPPEAPAAFGPCRDVLTDTRLAQLYGLPVQTLAFEAAGRARRAIVPLYSEVRP